MNEGKERESMGDDLYSKQQVCDILGISFYTLNNWYRWQKKSLDSREISEEYLPKPIKITNAKGCPLMWTMHMIERLKEYKKRIVRGRNGEFGKYTNSRKH